MEDTVIYVFPNQLKSDYEGYSYLVNLYHATKDIKNKTIVIDFNKGYWFEANLCSALGAILHKIQDNNNQFQLINIEKQVETIFKKNLFLLNFEGDYAEDTHSTTIKFRRFDINAEKDFIEYLNRELLSQPDLPNMSPLLKKKINNSIYEIYSNAYTHGGCNYVYTCGQYYPNRKVLDFTMADLGTTIRSNVRKFLKDKTLSGSQTISWAVEEGNTTKTGSHPGGLGLSLIREFLKLNKGKIQIISSNGFWEEKKGHIFASDYDGAFIGTIVNMEFNLLDSNSYALKSEISPEEVF